MAKVQVKNLLKKFDANIAINNTSIDIEDGMFMVFLGPSGCGKTTTLRCIAGLEIPHSNQRHRGGHRPLFIKDFSNGEDCRV